MSFFLLPTIGSLSPSDRLACRGVGTRGAVCLLAACSDDGEPGLRPDALGPAARVDAREADVMHRGTQLPAMDATGVAAPTADGAEYRIALKAAKCPPVLARYPVAGPHNGGWDPSATTYTCPPHPPNAGDNSDFIAGKHFGNDIFAPKGLDNPGYERAAAGRRKGSSRPPGGHEVREDP